MTVFILLRVASEVSLSSHPLQPLVLYSNVVFYYSNIYRATLLQQG